MNRVHHFLHRFIQARSRRGMGCHPLLRNRDERGEFGCPSQTRSTPEENSSVPEEVYCPHIPAAIDRIG